MLEKHKMNRINELARKSKESALSEGERAEQAALRAEYLQKFRSGLKAQLEQIELVDGEPKGGESKERNEGKSKGKKTGLS